MEATSLDHATPAASPSPSFSSSPPSSPSSSRLSLVGLISSLVGFIESNGWYIVLTILLIFLIRRYLKRLSRQDPEHAAHVQLKIREVRLAQQAAWLENKKNHVAEKALTEEEKRLQRLYGNKDHKDDDSNELEGLYASNKDKKKSKKFSFPSAPSSGFNPYIGGSSSSCGGGGRRFGSAPRGG